MGHRVSSLRVVCEPCLPYSSQIPSLPATLMISPNPSHKICFSTRHLGKVYITGDIQVHALRDVTLEIYEGEMAVLLGPSGSGKSTLLNILGGIDHPTRGQVFFRGLDLTALTDQELTEFRRRQVGFVFQFYNLIPSLTARENVEIVTEISPDPMPARDALHLVGLHGRSDHFPAQLSGGEQQRVAIARAIAKRPAVLLCDEPTGALDSTTGVVVLDAIAKVGEELGTSIAIITHNAVIADMADRVISFADGHVVNARENAEKTPALELHW